MRPPQSKMRTWIMVCSRGGGGGGGGGGVRRHRLDGAQQPVAHSEHKSRSREVFGGPLPQVAHAEDWPALVSRTSVAATYAGASSRCSSYFSSASILCGALARVRAASFGRFWRSRPPGWRRFRFSGRDQGYPEWFQAVSSAESRRFFATATRNHLQPLEND